MVIVKILVMFVICAALFWWTLAPVLLMPMALTGLIVLMAAWVWVTEAILGIWERSKYEVVRRFPDGTAEYRPKKRR